MERRTMDFLQLIFAIVVLAIVCKIITKANFQDERTSLNNEIQHYKSILAEKEQESVQRQERYLQSTLKDPQNQIREVSNAPFTTKKLMNRSEYEVFKTLEKWLQAHSRTGYRLFAQVSMGEYLGSKHDPAYNSINSKRSDFLIIDQWGNPLAAIEYQGSGHNQQNAAERDRVKAIALNNAGVPLVEIFPHDSPKLIIDKVSAVIA